MPYCERCGQKYDKRAEACPKCGTKLNVASLDAKRYQVKKEQEARKSLKKSIISMPVFRPRPTDLQSVPRISPSKLAKIPKASFFDRAIARLVDTLILLVPSIIAGTVVPILGGVVINVLYFVQCYVSTGQTIGHRLMNIKVVSTNGYPITYEQAIYRYFGAVLSGFVTLGIGFLMYFWNPNRQTLHDKIARTYVISLEERALQVIDGKG